jgi:hypothetical protein
VPLPLSVVTPFSKKQPPPNDRPIVWTLHTEPVGVEGSDGRTIRPDGLRPAGAERGEVRGTRPIRVGTSH